MSTQQPVWKLVGQLGDVHPIDYGGYWVFEDLTGVYAPEGELLTPDDDEAQTFTVRRFCIEPCTYQNGILSDNKFHPNLPAWFAKTEAERVVRPQDTTYLSLLAKFVGETPDEFAAHFCSDNVLERAGAWRVVGEYHGFDNLDPDPLRLNREEAEKRYADPKYKMEKPCPAT